MLILIKLILLFSHGVVIGMVTGLRVIFWWYDWLVVVVRPVLRFLFCDLFGTHWARIKGVGGYERIGWAFYRIKFYKCVLCDEQFVKGSTAARAHKFYFDI